MGDKRANLCKAYLFSVGVLVPPNGRIEYLGPQQDHDDYAAEVIANQFPDEYQDNGMFRGQSCINYLVKNMNYIRVANFSSYSGKHPTAYHDLYWRMIVLMIDRLTKGCEEEVSGKFVIYAYEWGHNEKDAISSDNRVDFINKLRYKGKVPENYHKSELSSFRESLSRIIFEEIMKEI